MSDVAEDHKAHIRRWIEAYNARDHAAEADARAPGYVAHAPGVPPLDSEAWTAFVGGFADAFPDIRLTVEDVLSEEDRVAARVTFRGTHTGDFQGLPPTGRQVEFSAIEVNRMVDGRVAEHWVVMDQLAMLQQLGLMVVPGPRLLMRILRRKATRLRLPALRRSR